MNRQIARDRFDAPADRPQRRLRLVEVRIVHQQQPHALPIARLLERADGRLRFAILAPIVEQALVVRSAGSPVHQRETLPIRLLT